MNYLSKSSLIQLLSQLLKSDLSFFLECHKNFAGRSVYCSIVLEAINVPIPPMLLKNTILYSNNVVGQIMSFAELLKSFFNALVFFCSKSLIYLCEAKR